LKIGDIVRGNAGAYRYSITTPGSDWVVANISYQGKTIDLVSKRQFRDIIELKRNVRGMDVDPRCFDVIGNYFGKVGNSSYKDFLITHTD